MKRLLLPARPEELVGISMARGPEVTRRLKRVIERIDNSPLTRRAIALFFLAAAISITALAGLRVVHAEEANLPPANKITPADVPPGARVLHFPANRSLGIVYINGKHYDGRPYYYMPTSFGRGDYEWERVGEARGDVLIPAGKLVKLDIAAPVIYGDLSPLAKLGPDDIHHLELRYDYQPPDGPAEKTPAGFNASNLLAPFTGWTGLKVLDINYTRIGDKGLEPLRGFTSLERLYPGRGLGEKGLQLICGLKSLKGLYILIPPPRASLAQLSNLDKLEELWVYKKTYAAADLEMFPSMRSLKWLKLAGSVPDRTLAPIARMPALKHLQLSDGTTDRHLAILAASRTLEDIDADASNQITDDGVASLKSMPALKSLDVRSSKLSNKSIETLSQIKTLEEISCTAVDMDDDALIALARLPNLRKIEFALYYSIDPQRNKRSFTARGLAALADKNTLEDLWIGSRGIDDDALAQIARMTRLKKLSLFPLMSATNAGLAQLKSLKSLEHLYLSNNSDAITLAGLTQMSPLPNLKFAQIRSLVQDYSGLDLSGWPNVQTLMVDVRTHQSFTDDDLKGIASCKHITHISLGDCSLVTDRGLAQLAGLTELSTRFCLYGRSQVTDAGLKSLAGMQRLGGVEIGGRITDAGLAELAKLPLLQGVGITTSEPISPEGLDKLKRLPFMMNCRVGPADIVNPGFPQPRKVGEDAPDIKFTTLDGKETKLSSLKKIAMVHFWSTWEKNSLDENEIARLKQVNAIMTKKFPGKFVLISIAMDDNDALWRETVKRQGMDWMQGRNHTSSAASYQLGFKTMPVYYLIDPDGKILLNPESSWKNIDAVIEKALK
ncbi:MAG: hypothetical protein ABFD69_12085 [Candidatus Sumerlaeia bacterium]